jgi:hypothetical protein
LFGFFYQSGIKHGQHALVNTSIEFGATGVETDPQDGEALQGISARFPLLTHRTLSAQTDFNCSNELGDIVGVNSRRCFRIETLQHAVQIRWPSFVRPCAQPFSQFFRTLRTREQSVQKRS